jgi:hypothetical protein
MSTKKSPDAKYSKLLGKVEYDHEAAEQLADALNEIVELEARTNQLKQIVKENEDLHQFVWRTSGNETIAIHNIKDDHLENLMMHLLRGGRPIPRAIRGEAIARSLTIPSVVPLDWETKSLEAKWDREDVL